VGVDDGSPQWLGDYGMINVDLSGLDKFAGSVESEVEGNFRPHAERLFGVYLYGVRFGVGNASADVTAAKLKHRDCLSAAGEQLSGYAAAAQILIEAARQVAGRYRGVDALSAAKAADVDAALSGAIQSAAAARDAAAAAAEADARELRRRGIV
jgi:hypothetical protein